MDSKDRYNRLFESSIKDEVQEIYLSIEHIRDKMKFIVGIKEDLNSLYAYDIFKLTEMSQREKEQIEKELEQVRVRVHKLIEQYKNNFKDSDITFVYNYILRTIRMVDTKDKIVQGHEYFKSVGTDWATLHSTIDSRSLKWLIELYKKNAIAQNNKFDEKLADIMMKTVCELEVELDAIFLVVNQQYEKKIKG